MEPQLHCPPLPDNASCFRLLTLEPGDVGENIACFLRVAPIPQTFASTLPYDALSYAWDYGEHQHEITIGAWPVLVQDNLWNFLNRRRHHSEPVTLWVDALCIDQSDLRERAAQVQVMDTIYEAAQRVFVWLGASGAEGALVQRLMNRMSKSITQPTVTCRDAEYQELLSWARRKYWTRTWVVQEFLLARNLVMAWGDNDIEWSDAERAMRHVFMSSRRAGKESNRWSLFMQTPAFTLMQQRMDRRNTKRPLEILLEENQHTSCYNPRDRVFALLGLTAPSKNGTRIIVNYVKDVRLLLWEVVEYCQLLPQNIVRFVSFLMKLLQVPDRSLATTSWHAFPGQLRLKHWELPFFLIGRVVSCDMVEGPIPAAQEQLMKRNFPGRSQTLVPVTAGRHSRNSTSQDQSHQQPDFRTLTRTFTTAHEAQQSDSMIEMLDESLLSRLKDDYSTLGPISNRSRSWGNRHTAIEAQRRTPHLFNLSVLTSYCNEKQFLMGIGYGNINKGDCVLYSFGHEVAFTINGTTLISDQTELTGRALCLSEDGYNRAINIDNPPQPKFWTVRNEAELLEPGEKVQLNLTTWELYILSR